MTHTRIGILLFALFFSFSVHAQKKEGVVFSNAADSALTIHTITYIPATDNVDGIFSRPIDKKMQELLENDHQWQNIDSQFAGAVVTPYELIRNPGKVTKLAAPLKADAVMTVEVRKNPKDFVMALYIFSGKDGKLISQSSATDLDQSSTEKAMIQLQALYKDLKYRIPYDGMILSRTKNRVTLNLGQTDGVTAGQTLNVSKIIEVKRHPKLGHILQHEKALIGTVRIVKADKNLSFADIISESESGAIQKESKITGARPVAYTPESWINKDYMPPEMLLSQDNQVNGKIQEWKPEMPPTFGRIGASLGVGPYQYNLSLADGRSLTSKSKLYPSVNLEGELWLNPEWYMLAKLSQGTAAMKNPVGGGSPSELSSSLGQYSLDVGYNLLLRDDFFDAKLYFALGFMKYRMSVDHSSPEGLTTAEYSAMRLTIGGKTPVDANNQWYLGGNLMWHFSPSLRESPINYGDDKSRIVNFNFSLDYRYSERIWFNSAMNFQTMMTDFSGAGTSTIPGTKSSHRFQTLHLGVSYMF